MLDVVHSRAIGVALPAPGLVLVDLTDLHRLEHEGLLGPAEPHMAGATPLDVPVDALARTYLMVVRGSARKRLRV